MIDSPSDSLSQKDLPALPPGALTDFQPKKTPGWVTSRDHHLYLNDRLFDFRSFNAPSLLEGTTYQGVDTFRSIAGFGSPVTRTYTLRVGNEVFGGTQKNKNSHIVGWNSTKNDWEYNELEWVRFDRVLSSASREGVKIIFPIINQDYGKISENFKGNWMDLIRHRYNVTDYNRALLTTDWFVDTPIREEFKKIIKYTLERRNTINGKIYGEDDTFLAFETGNEMNWTEFFDAKTNETIKPGLDNPLLSLNSTNPSNSTLNFTMLHIRPAPAEWTIDIAKYIKSLSPNALVMDGSYARVGDPVAAWPEETLKSPYVDLFSYHYYGEFNNITSFQQRVESFGKAFIAGEHGFYSSATTFQKFYDEFKGAGALVWSLRPHSEVSGFDTHSEGNNIYSYHIPGWKNQTAETFDQIEYDVVRITYKASFDILSKNVSTFPIPGPTYPFFASNGSSTGISFKGAAWADKYEIWAATFAGISFVKVGEEVTDNVESGQLFIQVDPRRPTLPLYVPPWQYLVGPRPPQTGWADDKWSDHPTQHVVVLDRLRKRSLDTDQDPFLLPRGESGKNRTQSETTTEFKSTSYHSRTVRIRSNGDLDGRSSKLKSGENPSGGWYRIRSISADGTPGYFSKPVFISDSDSV